MGGGSKLGGRDVGGVPQEKQARGTGPCLFEKGVEIGRETSAGGEA